MDEPWTRCFSIVGRFHIGPSPSILEGMWNSNCHFIAIFNISEKKTIKNDIQNYRLISDWTGNNSIPMTIAVILKLLAMMHRFRWIRLICTDLWKACRISDWMRMRGLVTFLMTSVALGYWTKGIAWLS